MSSACMDVQSKTQDQPVQVTHKSLSSSSTKSSVLCQDPRLERMLLEHWSMIRIILGKMRYRLPLGADLEELHSAGLMGLIDAIHKFDDARGYSFETYASFRVRGA
ncbi:MAG TPA: sigma factor, partial [Opitutales bacterium]|nr:sigma factor [Opitutales bacterium]